MDGARDALREWALADGLLRGQALGNERESRHEGFLSAAGGLKESLALSAAANSSVTYQLRRSGHFP
jgi:hypothetical protein